jgi:S-adenosylmethionine:tRNA ribosyltransferase-isomerase
VNAVASPPSLPTAAFDYELPEERIAQEPLPQRDQSRLLVVNPDGSLADHGFAELASLLRPRDVCVVNDTRVRHARLRGRRGNGGAVELLVAGRLGSSGSDYTCLVRPGRRLGRGERVTLGEELEAVVVGAAPEHPGARVVRFTAARGDVEGAIERAGEAPLPPYIRKRLTHGDRYQTVYAAGPSESAAAPTAGLHFTQGVISSLRDRGVGWASIRLDVGLPTFSPMRTDDVFTHVMHGERFSVPDDTARAIASARALGGRVVAVGTTVVRALESCTDEAGRVYPGQGTTSLFIAPGHRFGAVDALLTNFHQPRSSLLVLLAAFMGMDRWRSAYEHALRSDYRFLSFGDCMLSWAPSAA